MASKKRKKKGEYRYTHLQSLFVESFIALGLRNGTLACKIAGYKGSDNVLGVQAYKLLRMPKIQALLNERLDEVALSANQILMELSMVATASLDEVVNVGKDGMVRVREKALESHGHLIKSIRTSEGKTIISHITLHDKLRALQLLGQFRALWQGDGVIINMPNQGDPFSDNELVTMVAGGLTPQQLKAALAKAEEDEK